MYSQTVSIRILSSSFVTSLLSRTLVASCGVLDGNLGLLFMMPIRIASECDGKRRFAY